MSNRPPVCPNVIIRNLQRTIRVNLPALRRSVPGLLEAVWRAGVAAETALGQLTEISVLLISDRRMADLHWRFLGCRGPTDVLTFDHGEIFVSVEMARRNARVFKNSLVRELQLYMIHALLHLSGFDDREPKAAKRMRRVQESILSSLK